MVDSLLSGVTQCLSGSRFLQDSESRPHAMVRIHPSNGLGAMVELCEGLLTVGRDADCDVQLPDDSVSRRHARFEIAGDECVLVDQGSTNGVYVNNQRISRQLLAPGDRVRLGNQIFRFLGADRIETEYYEAVFRMMTTDGLTEACNKRYLMEMLQRELKRAQRTQRSLSVVMFDVDHFKKINDQFGHLAGDDVLCELCRRVRTVLRADEVLARYGGEEFTLVLAETTLEEARQLAERLRLAICERPFAVEGATVPVTISLGLGELAPGETINSAQLLARADQQLYTAKRQGRNQVCG